MKNFYYNKVILLELFLRLSYGISNRRCRSSISDAVREKQPLFMIERQHRLVACFRMLKNLP